MLYLIMKDGRTGAWHVGEKTNRMSLEVIREYVAEVQADEDELRYILFQCDNLPTTKGATTQHWYGDHAKFIVANVVR